MMVTEQMSKKLVILHSTYWSPKLPTLVSQCNHEIVQSTDFVFLDTNTVIEQGIDNTIDQLSLNPPDGIVGMNDDASLFAAIVSEKLDLPGPSLSAVTSVQNKYQARCKQRLSIPHATPAFKLATEISQKTPFADTFPDDFPVIMKPVRSHLSLDTYIIHSEQELRARLRQMDSRRPSPKNSRENAFVKYLENKTLATSDTSGHTNDMLIETYASGEQYTVDGYIHEGKCVFLGYTLSEFLPDTLSFSHFSYPYQFNPHLKAHIEETIQRYIFAAGLNNTMFNAEFRIDQNNETLTIIEVNTRIASQFIQMIYHVTGTSSIEYMLMIALGEDPAQLPESSDTKYQIASSCVLRRQHDAVITRIPDESRLAQIQDHYPDVQIVNFVKEGQKLSDVEQDPWTYRYARVNIPGKSKEDIDQQLTSITKMLGYDFSAIPNNVAKWEEVAK